MASIDYSKLKILLVEDEDYTRQLIRQLLHQLGVRSISEAGNGKDGLLEILRTRPDIVFCDIHMKPIGGLELLRQLRAVKLPAIAGTAVVMLTADASNEAVVSAKELTVNGYLVKPVSLTHLKARIDTVMANQAGLADLVTRRES
jgi:two-component system chemotaxis response regulator CheY